MDAIERLGQWAADPLIKAGKGIEVAGHKYLMRTPDGKGGWKYSYKPPAEHQKQRGVFDPVALKHAIEHAAVDGRSHPFLMPHDGKVYLATASGRYGAKEIAISGFEVHGATPDNVDFDLPRSLAHYPKFVKVNHTRGDAPISTGKATPIAVVPPPSPKKKKDTVPVWHEGQWKHVPPLMADRYERETANFKYDKSADAIDALVPLIKADDHKYVSKKPDGKGGYSYKYEKDHTVQSMHRTVSAVRKRDYGGYDKGHNYSVHDPEHLNEKGHGHHTYASFAQGAAAQKKDVLKQHSDKFGVNAKLLTLPRVGKLPRMPDEGIEHPGEAIAGHVKVSNRDGSNTDVPATLYGNYAVHGEPGAWSVSHKQTGSRMFNAKTKAEATQYARHMKQRAPDVLTTAKFGQIKFQGDHEAEFAQMRDAHHSFVKKSADAIDALLPLIKAAQVLPC